MHCLPPSWEQQVSCRDSPQLGGPAPPHTPTPGLSTAACFVFSVSSRCGCSLAAPALSRFTTSMRHKAPLHLSCLLAPKTPDPSYILGLVLSAVAMLPPCCPGTRQHMATPGPLHILPICQDLLPWYAHTPFLPFWSLLKCYLQRQKRAPPDLNSIPQSPPEFQ